MMERADSAQKLYTRMRLWEFPDQYVIEPTDGSSGASLAVSRIDGSLSLIGKLLSLFVWYLRKSQLSVPSFMLMFY